MLLIRSCRLNVMLVRINAGTVLQDGLTASLSRCTVATGSDSSVVMVCRRSDVADRALHFAEFGVRQRPCRLNDSTRFLWLVSDFMVQEKFQPLVLSCDLVWVNNRGISCRIQP